MTDVTFYVLSSHEPYLRYLFACRLIEKAYSRGQFCYVQLDFAEQCHYLDELLWTFRAGSFVAHQCFDSHVPAIKSQVLIGTLPAPDDWQDLQLNLSSQLPATWQKAKRVLEILDHDEAIKIAGRDRYRLYKEHGATLETHKL